jgi:hypothetical protein
MDPRSLIRSNTCAANVRHDGTARIEPSRDRNDWSCKPQTKAVKAAFTPLKAQVRTFGIR